jgi:hypothetical protein
MNSFGPNQVWTNPETPEGKPCLYRLTPEALELVVAPKGELESAALIREPQREYAAQKIPLAIILQLEGEEGGDDLTVTYKLAEDKKLSVTINLVDGAQRDEFLDALMARLGPFWIRETRSVGRWKGILWPLGIAGLIGFFTWIMYQEAQRMAAGEQLKVGRGRQKIIREVMHWVEGELGPDGVLIAGVVFGTLAILWFLIALVKPPMRVVVKPRDVE